MAQGYFLEIVNGSPVRVKAFDYDPANITPEFKTLPDYHQELLQESKRLNDEMRHCLMAAPI